MMDRIRTPAGVMPFETNRSVANATNNAAVDARYWSTRMAAVSVQHDRTSFMRIYDRRTVAAALPARPGRARQHGGRAVAGGLAATVAQGRPVRSAARQSLHLAVLHRPQPAIDHVRREPHWLPIQDGLDWLDHQLADLPHSPPEALINHDTLKQAIDKLPAVEARARTGIPFATDALLKFSPHAAAPARLLRPSTGTVEHGAGLFCQA